MLRRVIAFLAGLAALVLLQSVTQTICLVRDRAAPAAPNHDTPLPPPPPPPWMARSPLAFNLAAHRTLTRLLPSRDTTLHLTLASSAMTDWVASWKGHATAVGLALQRTPHFLR